MNITPNTTPQEIKDYYIREKTTFLEPLSRSFNMHIGEAKADKVEVERLGYALRAAERRITELEREVRELEHYREVVTLALADVGETL